MTKTGTALSITQADARTALGLGTAAYAATGDFDAAGAASTALANAKTYADGLATNYDAAGAATTALNSAKSYADSLATNYDAKGAAAAVEAKLATVATTGKMDDLTQTNTIVFNCGTASTVL